MSRRPAARSTEVREGAAGHVASAESRDKTPGDALAGWSPRLLLATGIVVLALLALLIAAFAYTGSFTRYAADDFCIAAHVHHDDLLGAQAFWYLNWTGRFSYVLVTDLVAFIGEGAVGYFSPLVILVWGLILAWTAWQVMRLHFGQASVLASLLVSAAVLCAYLLLIPTRDESVYWVSGGANYTVPLLVLTLNAGFVAWTVASGETNLRRAGLVTMALAFFASGFAETFIAWHLTLLTTALLLVARFGTAQRKPALTLLSRALAGAFAGALAVAAAPGNLVRQDSMPANSILETASDSVQSALSLMGELLLRPETWLTSGVVLVTTTLYFSRKPEQSPLGAREVAVRVGLAVTVAFVLVVATFVPSHFLLSLATIPRGLVFGVLTMILTATYVGHLGGRVLAAWLAQRPEMPRLVLSPMALALVLIVAGLAVPPALLEARRYDELSDYAAAWEERDQVLEAAGARPDARRTVDVTVAEIPYGSRRELRPTPDHFINQCASSYYGVRSIDAVPR